MEYTIKIRKKSRNPIRERWIWKTAYKDARYHFYRLFLFISSVVIGIAALVAIDSFNINLQRDLDAQSRELLGADLAIRSRNKAFDTTFIQALDTTGYTAAVDARFASMVFFPKNKGTRLIQVIAIGGDYPFYGEIGTTSGSDLRLFRSGKGVLIDESLATQFGVQPGDTLKLGNAFFAVGGIVTTFPGNTEITTSFSPSVYLAYGQLERTGLIQYGSRVRYNYYLKMPAGDVEPLIERMKPAVEQHGYSWDTIESRKEDLGRSFENLYRFFNLLGFIALMLGSIGVASSVHIYVKEKKQSAAVLRCLGASGWQVFSIFFLQIGLLGLLGSIVGALHGMAIQYAIPWIVHDFLPVDVDISPAWPAVGKGIIVGLIISVLFSILPLSNMRLVAPLSIIRSSVQAISKRSKFKSLVYVLLLLFPWLFAVRQTDDWLNGSLFYGGLLVVFIALTGVAKLLLYAIRRFFPHRLSFVWRQGLSNLYRPGNQTVVLVVVIGLGAFLLTTMVLIQHSLLGQVEFSGREGRSNTVLFDIQPAQREALVGMADEYNIPVQQMVPIVTARMDALRGRPVEEVQQDTAAEVRDWALTREYRVTYRDTLIDSETVVQGTFTGNVDSEKDTVWISVSDGLQRALHLELGDEIVFNVQGVKVPTYVGSIREVDWRRVQTNFMVVFPRGVLENAPQFFVLITRIDAKEKAAAFQRELVGRFPNVSAIDLTLILNTLDQIFDKVAFVIRFMAAFSVLTGLLVLSGAILNSKYIRLRENVLLRTIGAIRKQIRGLTLVEYTFLGVISALAGSLLSILGSWILMRYFFEVAFFIDIMGIVVVWLIITALTVVVGWFNTGGILNKSPMEVLRKET